MNERRTVTSLTDTEGAGAKTKQLSWHRKDKVADETASLIPNSKTPKEASEEATRTVQLAFERLARNS